MPICCLLIVSNLKSVYVYAMFEYDMRKRCMRDYLCLHIVRYLSFTDYVHMVAPEI